jgi:hypothetical protein
MSGMLFGTVDMDDRFCDNVWRVGRIQIMDVQSMDVAEYALVRRGLDPKKESGGIEKAPPGRITNVTPNHNQSGRPGDTCVLSWVVSDPREHALCSVAIVKAASHLCCALRALANGILHCKAAQTPHNGAYRVQEVPLVYTRVQEERREYSKLRDTKSYARI